MKQGLYTDIICRSFCSHFKKEKEDLLCGGYRFLKDNFTPLELRQMTDFIDRPEELKKNIPPDNKYLFDLVCSRCDFLIDGCDYRDNRSGPPCGGFLLIGRLING